MESRILGELERLTYNATQRRHDLLLRGVLRGRTQKRLTVVAGLLALLSAGAVTVVLTRLFGDWGIQLLAALTATLSGAISLVVATYFGDEQVLGRLTGASKYLSLREAANRLALDARLGDDERFSKLVELQDEYAKLDEEYSRFFSPENLATGSPGQEAHDAALAAVERLNRDIKGIE